MLESKTGIKITFKRLDKWVIKVIIMPKHGKIIESNFTINQIVEELERVKNEPF